MPAPRVHFEEDAIATSFDISRSRATGGNGLGLAIVRAIVESHGGHLTLVNDDGAVVTARLPA